MGFSNSTEHESGLTFLLCKINFRRPIKYDNRKIGSSTKPTKKNPESSDQLKIARKKSKCSDTYRILNVNNK